jgi:hypothetical protein
MESAKFQFVEQLTAAPLFGAAVVFLFVGLRVLYPS